MSAEATKDRKPLCAESAFGPEQGGDPEALIKLADTAMYAAKGAGRNQVCAYAAAMGDPTTEDDLPEAA